MTEYVDAWNYHDGLLSGLWVLDSGLYYFELQGDDLYPADEDLGRCYDLWLLHEVPTLDQAKDRSWRPAGSPVGHIYENELREFEQQSHPEIR